jgi:acyl-coenzyme A synthetase/AMP-(fatty) acid ligase
MTSFPYAAAMDRIASRPISGMANTTRVLVVPGLTTSFGFWRAAELLGSGKTVCCGKDADSMLRMVDLFAVETIIASPQQIVSLLDWFDQQGDYETKSLKEVVIGGGYSSPDLFGRVQKKLCRDVVYNYGATETGVMALARYDLIEDVPNAVGYLAPGVAVQIVDADDKPVPTGTKGRVKCRTDYFVAAFTAKHSDRAVGIDDIWWNSNDLGLITEDGILCVLGRADDVINIGGVKISGVLLDDLLQNVPGVKDAGICGVPGPSGIDELWIGLVPDPAPTIEKIKEAIVRIPELHECKFEMFVLESIPRNELGKISRNNLKEVLLGVRKQVS